MSETTPPVYNVDYFIAKFEAIPEELWTVAAFNIGDKCCALGHCGVRSDVHYDTLPESLALATLMEDAELYVTVVNDGENSRFTESTPRARILAALREIKAKGAQ